MRSSTRATSVGSEAAWKQLGFIAGLSRVKVPVASSARVSSSHSCVGAGAPVDPVGLGELGDLVRRSRGCPGGSWGAAVVGVPMVAVMWLASRGCAGHRTASSTATGELRGRLPASVVRTYWIDLRTVTRVASAHPAGRIGRAAYAAGMPGTPLRVAVVNDYEIVVVGIGGVLQRFPDRVEVVELDSGMPVPSEVDLVLYDSFGQPQGAALDVAGRGRRVRRRRSSSSAGTPSASWSSSPWPRARPGYISKSVVGRRAGGRCSSGSTPARPSSRRSTRTSTGPSATGPGTSTGSRRARRRCWR